MRKTTACVLLALAACAAQDGTVRSAYGPAAPLDGFGPTYAWMQVEHSAPQRPGLDRPDLHQLVQQLLDSGLASKGYVQGQPADFLVHYELSTQYHVERTDWDPVAYEAGSLILYVAEPETSGLMWSGSFQAKLNAELDPPERRARIENAVNEILARFPDPTSDP